VRKRNLYIWGAPLLVVVLVLLLPLVLSSGVVLNLAVSGLNSRIPGNIKADDCSIGWQKGLQCTGIVYQDTRQGINFRLDRLTGSQGLLAVIVSPFNFGTITLQNPVVIFSAEKKQPLQADEKTSPSLSTDTQASSPSDSPPFWDKLTGKVVVGNAVVKCSPDKIIVEKGEVQGRIAEGTAQFEARIQAPDQGGSATATGFINLPTRRDNLLNTLVAEINLHVMDLQVEPFLSLVPEAADFPQGTGELSAEMRIMMAGVDDLKTRGTAMLRNLRLAGGLLKTDTPSFKQVNLDFDADCEGTDRWHFPDLRLSADFGTMQLKGSAVERDLSLEGKGKLELPVLFSQFPGLLKVQTGTMLQAGVMDVSLLVKRNRQRVDGVAEAVISEISGIRNDRPFAWKSPVSGSLSGSFAENKPTISSLQVKAPFLDLEGEGDLASFTLRGSADLAQAVREIGTLFDVGWDAEGTLHLQASSKEEEPGRFTLETKVDISDFALSRQGKRVMPEQSLTFSGLLKTPAKFPATSVEAADLHVELNGWPGTISADVDGLFRQAGTITGRARVQTDLQLARVSDLLHNMGWEPETTLAGRMEMQAAGYLEKNRLVLHELDSRIHDCIYYRKGVMFRDPLVRVQLSGAEEKSWGSAKLHPLETAATVPDYFANGGGRTMIDTTARKVRIRDLGLMTDKGRLDISRLVIDDWHRLPATLGLQAKGSGDLARMTPLFRQYGVLQQEQSLDGSVAFSLDMKQAQKKVQTGRLKVEVSEAAFGENGNILIENQSLAGSVRFQGNLGAGDFFFNSLELQTNPLQLRGNGHLEHRGKEHFLFFKGEIIPDFGGVAEIMSKVLDMDIRGSGGIKEPLEVQVPLNPEPEKKFDGMKFSTILRADYMDVSGILMSDITLPVHMADSGLEMQLTSAVNGGRLQFTSTVDLSQVPPVAVVPENEQVLAGVGIRKTLADILLKRINPLFGLLARPSGTLGVTMEHFNWPLAADGAQQADFSTVLNISKVHLVPDGILQEILEIVHLGDEQLTLNQSELACKGADGRVSCTPLKILVADSEMILSGSVGFDGSIDYLLQVPVTRKLVGEQGYRVLEGATLKIPITGDLETVSYDRKHLAGMVTDLLVQAGVSEVETILQKQSEQVLPGLMDSVLGN
jgi:hypothetical protein